MGVFGALSCLVDFDNRTLGLDRFFDEVLIMDKDESVRNNRISLIGEILGLYLAMADFSVITI